MHELQVHQIELEMQNEALRQAQIEVETSRDRYLDLYELAPVGYMTLDRSGMIEQTNTTGASLLDIERKALLHRRFARHVSPEDCDRWERRFMSVMTRGDDEQSIELELMRGDGSRFPARIDFKRVLADAAPATARIALSDVSRLKLAEARADAAMVSLEREGGILDAVLSGAKAAHLAYLSCDFDYIRVNETYAASRGYQPEQLLGKNLFELYPDPETEALFTRARDTGIPAEARDHPVVFPDRPQRGTTYWDWTLIPVKNASGEMPSLMYTLVETTDRVRKEAERIRALEAQRDSLVRQVRHRIKNHLQGVVGLLRARIADQCETCEPLEKAIGQIRTIAKAYGLQGNDKVVRTTVEQLARAAVESLAYPIEMEVGSPPGAAPYKLASDETVAMALVINELLTNAIKHGSNAAKRVRVRLATESACSRVSVENAPATLPEGFDWEAGFGLGTGLELLRTLIPDKGASLSYRQEGDRVIADLALSEPIVVR